MPPPCYQGRGSQQWDQRASSFASSALVAASRSARRGMQCKGHFLNCSQWMLFRYRWSCSCFQGTVCSDTYAHCLRGQPALQKKEVSLEWQSCLNKPVLKQICLLSSIVSWMVRWWGEPLYSTAPHSSWGQGGWPWSQLCCLWARAVGLTPLQANVLRTK